MSQNINVRRDVEDKFYRYKMPKLIAKVEGKGNGIKTIVVNMSAISTALSRPPTYATKFFGFELGALTIIDEKTDRYGVNGAHTAEKLANLLDVFITKFVLCDDCKNPETDVLINNKKNAEEILKDCKACGAKTNVDLRHRLGTYMIKNPPANSISKKYKKKMKKEGPVSVNTAGEDGGATPSSKASHDGSGDDDELTKRIHLEAENITSDHLKDDDDWAEDMSPAAIAARQKELSSEIRKNISDLVDPLKVFSDFIAAHPLCTPSELKTQATSIGVSDDKAVVVLFQTVFDETLSPEKIEQKAPLFKPFLTSEKAQKRLLGGFERLVGHHFPQLIPRTPIFLKAIFDEELVEEDVVKEWGSKPSKRFVERKISKEIRAKALPFLTWLDEAESEESDSE